MLNQRARMRPAGSVEAIPSGASLIAFDVLHVCLLSIASRTVRANPAMTFGT